MNKTCETERLILKILSSDAAPIVLDFYDKNREIFEPWEPLRSEHFYTLAYQKASLSAELHRMAEGKLLRYWVFLKNDPDELVGSVCIQNILRGPYQSCSLGYKFDQQHHHRGYALESTQKMIQIAFDEYKLHRMEAFIMPGNKPSLRLIEQLSFLYEGISRSFAQINGTWFDHKRYAYINPKDSMY